jgi:quercetin dioxygenase-like cupin family protein
MEAAGLTWRKAKVSGPNGGQCVEVAYGPDGRATGHVRDSKRPAAGSLSVTPEVFGAFLVSAKRGELDLGELRGTGAVEKVNLAREAAQLTEFWCQQVLASGNGNLFKVAKGIGSTNWHRHDDQDEVFLVIDGRITIQLRDRDIALEPGDLFVIPRGTEHCPVAHEEARFLLIGPEVTSNAAGGKPDWSYSSGP